MEFLKIVLFCILAAIGYGVVHDQFTARVSLEYFTLGRPPIFNTTSPTLLGLGWGVLATWWFGLLLGLLLAVVARVGKRPKLTVKQLIPAVVRLLGFMACIAIVAGLVGYALAARGTVQLPEWLASTLPPSRQINFVAGWWSHSGSYLAAFVGGITLIIWNWLRRSEAAE